MHLKRELAEEITSEEKGMRLKDASEGLQLKGCT